MYMPYTTNPHMPRLRMQTANLVLQKNWSTRKVAYYTGFNQSTVVRWVSKAKLSKKNTIPTKSSRPYHHPNQLSWDIVKKIVEYRLKYRRCAEVLHFLLKKDGYKVSLSSVKRTLKRHALIYPSKWKKWHKYPPRPVPKKPGILIQIDTIHDGPFTDRLYLYTLLDVCSRWTFVIPCLRINTKRSLCFVKKAQTISPFKFQTIQSDHGSEFSKWFTKRLVENGIAHRHSRVRMPSDNGHLERFNRTIQEECLNRIPKTLRSYQKAIPEYLNWYNTKRPHMGINMKTPLQVMQSY